MDELKQRLQESRLNALKPVYSELLNDFEINGYSLIDLILVMSQDAHQKGFPSEVVELLEEAATAAYKNFCSKNFKNGEIIHRKRHSGFQ